MFLTNDETVNILKAYNALIVFNLINKLSYLTTILKL